YPTDTAWDRDKRKQVKIANMAHMFGSDYVRMWKGSPDRKTVDEEDLVFDPTMTCSAEAINLYDGFAIEPTPCDGEDVDVMLQLLEHLCSRCHPTAGHAGVHDVMQWVLRWLALPLQQPGAKPRSSLVFHGPQGTGKNLFFDVIRGIYGKYGVMVGQTEIEEKYNGWLSAKLLVIGNEVVSRQELYHTKNRLKWIITEENIPIRTMHTDTRWESNHANVIFLSNERQPLALESGDRRFLVVYTPSPEDKGLYGKVRDFLANDGAAKFFHFLLHYPLGDFHEHTRPPMTEAKEELIGLSMQPAERFMSEWVDGFLHLPMQVCSAEQLYRAFRRWCDNSGERWPPAQATFTTAAKRWAIERLEHDERGQRLPPCLEYKVVTAPNDTGPRRSIRCWLPRGTGPQNGVSEGAWAGESVDAFELPLGRFLRTREGNEEADPLSPKGAKKGGSDGAVTREP
ncbi:MAG TPA: primase-helicase family protein, partial [Ramlibacter sp.]